MYIYVLFILIISFLLYTDSIEVDRFNTKISRYILFFTITFFLVYRFDVGFDYINYYKMIDEKRWIQIFRLEPLSILFHLICVYKSDPFLIFILYGLPTCFLFFVSISSYSKIFWISILYFLSFIYLESFSFIRQILALAITFYAYKYILSKSIIKYVVFCLIASMFHYSAIIAIFVYFVYWYLKPKEILIISICLFLFKNILFILFAHSAYSYYFDKLDDFTGGGLVRYVLILLFCVFVFLDKITFSQYKRDPFVSVIIPSLFFPFIFGPSLGMRLGAYFSVYMCLYIPNVMSRLSLRNRLLISVCYLCFSIIYFLLMIYIGSRNDFKELYTPYQFVFCIDNIKFK